VCPVLVGLLSSLETVIAALPTEHSVNDLRIAVPSIHETSQTHCK
jgi:hypothetical protein